MRKSVRIYILLAVCLALSATSVVAQDGTTAYNYLNTTTSSHAYALGGTNISVVDDDINLYEQNPALMGPEIDMQLGFNYMKYLGGSNFAGLRFGKEAGEHAAWGMGVRYFGYGEIKSADIAGVVTGSFHPHDLEFSGTYSHDFGEYWRGGITMKLLYSSYEQYSAFAIASDLGMNYYNPDKDLSFSVVLKNLGGQVKRFNDHYDKLPWDIQLGYSQSLNNGPFRLSIPAVHLNKWKLPYYVVDDKNPENSDLVQKDKFLANTFLHLIFALDYAPTEKFYVGVGYNYKTRTDMATYARNFLSGFSAGAGLRASKFRVGVALAQPHVGGMTLMLNLATNLYEF